MANIIQPNNPYVGGNLNECMWRLTRVMKKAGWTVMASSNNTTKVAPANNSTDNWGNNADPLLDIYPTAFGTTVAVAAPWIVLRGPSTIKIPITTAPTGSPLRGEKITQNATEGELLGYVFDTVSSSGWMVVLPRVGTFNNTDTITCAITAATFIPSPGGTIITFVREFMFSRNGGSSGDITDHQIFYICADVVAENAQLFSSLAATVGCTATIPPGCVSSGTNQFPALGIVIRGTAGTTTSGSSSPLGGATGVTTGSYHVACTNMIGATNVSPDGSFYLIGNSSTATNQLAGFGFTKIDDGDPGDCDPYLVIATQGLVAASWSRLVNVGATSPSTYAFGGSNIYVNPAFTFFGYQARGHVITNRDVPAIYCGGFYFNSQVGGSMTFNFPAAIRTLNHPAATPPITREAVMIWTPGNGTLIPPILKHYKGRARWISQVSLGNILDTFDGKKFICTGAASSTVQGIVVGPWDGITTPSP